MMDDTNVTEEAYQNEVILIDKYFENIVRARIKIDMTMEQSIGDLSQSASNTSKTNKTRYKLPKIELKKFSGQLID